MTRAEQAIRLFRVKRSAFYDFPLLGATATASTVSYIELFLSISVSSQGGCVRFLAFGFIREYGSYFFFFRNHTSFSDLGHPHVQLLMGHFWRSERLAGQKMTSTEPGPRVFSYFSFCFLFHEKT
jgi:hypothetical protein